MPSSTQKAKDHKEGKRRQKDNAERRWSMGIELQQFSQYCAERVCVCVCAHMCVYCIIYVLYVSYMCIICVWKRKFMCIFVSVSLSYSYVEVRVRMFFFIKFSSQLNFSFIKKYNSVLTAPVFQGNRANTQKRFMWKAVKSARLTQSAADGEGGGGGGGSWVPYIIYNTIF